MCSDICKCDSCSERENPQSDSAQKEITSLKWWLGLSQKQFAKIWQHLEDSLDAEKQVALLEEMGRSCAASVGWAQNYAGDPEGFFKFMNERMGEVFEYNKDSNTIMITTRERKCDCRFVASDEMPAVYCNCSKGWQKHTYETILGKKVDVNVLESVLSGYKRCVFEVTISDEDI